MLGTAAVPLRGVLGHRRLRPGGRGADLLTARPSRRRTVAELSVLVVAGAAVTAVRRQGLSSGGGVDPLLSGAPLLLGLAGALLLVRAYPWPLRALARPSARRGGPVGFLGLARAGRGSAGAALLPLLALLLALSVAAFGAEILGGVSAGREQAALLQTGADAQVAGSFAPLPTALVDAVRRSPGVGSVLALRHSANEPLNDQGPGANFDLYGIDPAPYLRLSQQDGAGGFDPALLDYRGGGPIPVLASPDLAAQAGSAPIPMDDAFGKYTVRIVGTVPGTPAQEAGGFMLVADAALDTLPRPHDPMARNPGTLLLGGRVDGDALRAAVQRTALGQPVTVLVRTEQLAALADSPQQSAVESVYLATIAAAGLLSVLAVLLALLQAAPGRSALLARLRTMGLTPGQGYRLILVEALPPVLTAVVAGTLLGLAAIPLFGPSVDLATLIGPVDPGLRITTGLQARALPLLAPAAALLLIAVGVVAAEAAVVGRRQIGTELRAGDQR
ncbi:FtsX-like permease family protein [Streptacidiphilus sp. PAMC 29251]